MKEVTIKNPRASNYSATNTANNKSVWFLPTDTSPAHGTLAGVFNIGRKTNLSHRSQAKRPSGKNKTTTQKLAIRAFKKQQADQGLSEKFDLEYTDNTPQDTQPISTAGIQWFGSNEKQIIELVRLQELNQKMCNKYKIVITVNPEAERIIKKIRKTDPEFGQKITIQTQSEQIEIATQNLLYKITDSQTEESKNMSSTQLKQLKDRIRQDLTTLTETANNLAKNRPNAGPIAHDITRIMDWISSRDGLNVMLEADAMLHAQPDLEHIEQKIAQYDVVTTLYKGDGTPLCPEKEHSGYIRADLGNSATSSKSWITIYNKMIAPFCERIKRMKKTVLNVESTNCQQANVERITVYDLLYGNIDGLEGAVDYATVYKAATGITMGNNLVGHLWPLEYISEYVDAVKNQFALFAYDVSGIFWVNSPLSHTGAGIDKFGIGSLEVREGEIGSTKQRKMPDCYLPKEKRVECERNIKKLEHEATKSETQPDMSKLEKKINKAKECSQQNITPTKSMPQQERDVKKVANHRTTSKQEDEQPEDLPEDLPPELQEAIANARKKPRDSEFSKKTYSIGTALLVASIIAATKKCCPARPKKAQNEHTPKTTQELAKRNAQAQKKPAHSIRQQSFGRLM